MHRLTDGTQRHQVLWALPPQLLIAPVDRLDSLARTEVRTPKAHSVFRVFPLCKEPFEYIRIVEHLMPAVVSDALEFRVPSCAASRIDCGDHVTSAPYGNAVVHFAVERPYRDINE